MIIIYLDKKCTFKIIKCVIMPPTCRRCAVHSNDKTIPLVI